MSSNADILEKLRPYRERNCVKLVSIFLSFQNVFFEKETYMAGNGEITECFEFDIFDEIDKKALEEGAELVFARANEQEGNNRGKFKMLLGQNRDNKGQVFLHESNYIGAHALMSVFDKSIDWISSKQKEFPLRNVGLFFENEFSLSEPASFIDIEALFHANNPKYIPHSFFESYLPSSSFTFNKFTEGKYDQNDLLLKNAVETWISEATVDKEDNTESQIGLININCNWSTGFVNQDGGRLKLDLCDADSREMLMRLLLEGHEFNQQILKSTFKEEIFEKLDLVF